MEKLYRHHRLFIIFLVLLFVSTLVVSGIDYKETFRKPLYILGFIAAIQGLLLSIPEVLLKKILINDRGIIEINRPQFKLFKKTIRALKWEEIGYIVDDYVQPILFYPPYKLHLFHLVPKDNISKPFKRITISYLIKNYKDLLSEVVSRVGPDVKIDDYVYLVVNKRKKQAEIKTKRTT